MNKNIIIFVICAVIGFGGGYLFFKFSSPVQQAGSDSAVEDKVAEEQPEEQASEAEQPTAQVDNILAEKGCLSCHAVSSLDLEGGATGPDLSTAYGNVEGKHGKPIDEFLKEPTSAVMSSVISGNPLSDEEIDKIVEVLKEASEK
ncbi:cytochrome c [Bacillus tianshenii]|nr:cytochrome c [Bacillus tianshenii]